MKRFDFIIISYNTKALTLQCIHSLLISNSKLNSEFSQYILENLIVVDNNSKDDTINEIHKFKSKNSDLFNFTSKPNNTQNSVNLIIIQNDENYGYAKACNIGINNSKNDLLIISNTDIIVFPSSIIGIFDSIINFNLAISGVQQLFPNFTWQRSYGLVPGIKLAMFNVFLLDKLFDKLEAQKVTRQLEKIEFTKVIENVSELKNYIIKNNSFFEEIGEVRQNIKIIDGYIDGAFLGIDKSKLINQNIIKLKELEKHYFQYFDENYFFYSEEMDLCHRANQTSKIGISPNNFVIHYRGSSTNTQITEEKNIEINFKAFDTLYNSKYHFCKKHLSLLTRKIYFLSEVIFFTYGIIGFGIFNLFSNLSNNETRFKISRRFRIYQYLAKLNFKLFIK